MNQIAMSSLHSDSAAQPAATQRRASRLHRLARHLTFALGIAAAMDAAGAAAQELEFPTLGATAGPECRPFCVDGVWWTARDGAAGFGLYQLSGIEWLKKLDLPRVGAPGAALASTCTLRDRDALFVLAWEPGAAALYELSERPSGNFALAAGFPIVLPLPASLQSVELARDSTGRLWAVCKSHDAVSVTCTMSSDKTAWLVPPLSLGAALRDDDIATVVSFGGNRLGVAWTEHDSGRVCFRMHDDQAALHSWGKQEIVRADYTRVDHRLDAKADPLGQVFLVASDLIDTIYVACRSAGGTWSVSTF